VAHRRRAERPRGSRRGHAAVPDDARRDGGGGMSRTVNDPRVAIIIAALDRAAESDRLHPGGLFGTVASSIVDGWINCPERFVYDDNGWTDDGIRAFVLAYALN